MYSDVIRISLLAEYGGLWLDSTVLCTGSHLATKMKDWPLFVFKMEDIDRTDEMALVCSNWLISCYTNVPFIKAVRDLLYCYWENEKHVKNYFVFHLFMHMVKDVYTEIWDEIPIYNNISPHILAFEMLNQFNEERFIDIKSMSDFHKLNRHVVDELQKTFDIDNTFYQMVLNQRAI